LDYNDALKFLGSLPYREVKPGLERTLFILNKLKNPQEKLTAIHIGGTNGKGSVAQMIASVLIEAGFKVGIYTSPHLVDLRERIVINREQISKEELTALVQELVPIVSEMVDKPTYFEALTALALRYFARQQVDLAVIEVGLGGRFDATNVLRSIITVITNVEFDHLDLLGDTLTKIAWEKAGIIKEGRPLITAETKAEPLKIIREECEKKNAKLYLADIKVENKGFNWEYQEFLVEGLGIIKLKMLGRFQRHNLALALKVLEVLKKEINIPQEAIIRGLERASWPGRFEVISKSPYVILDGAHNPHGCSSLRETIRLYDEIDLRRGNLPSRWLLFGVLKDKEVKKICEIIFPEFERIILTKPDSHRACELEVLEHFAAALHKDYRSFPAAKDALAYALNQLKEADVLYVTGSLYLVGEVKKLLRENKIR